MGALRLSDCVFRFLDWCKVRFRPATVSFYRTYLTRFCEYQPGRNLGDVTLLDIESWTAKRHPLVCVKRFFRWAVDKAKFLAADPSKGVSLPPGGRRSRTLTRLERVSMRRRSCVALRAFLLAVEESGARPHEWRLASWDNVHLVGGGIWTAADMAAGRCFLRLDFYKGQSRRENPFVPRLIPISARLGRLLVRLTRGIVTRVGSILRSTVGRPWSANALRCSFRRLRSRLDLGGDKNRERVVVYSYRHTKATELARRGVNGRILADFLGHASLDLLGWYVHPTEEDLSNLLRRTKRTIPPHREKKDA